MSTPPSQSPRRVSLRIVMPVLNEGAQLTQRLADLQALRRAGAELVVVDGGSTDESWARAQPRADQVLSSAPGRATQMNAGAALRTGREPSALLFLHADTRLPSDALALIESALRSHPWGRFDVRFDSGHWKMRMVAFFMNRRSRLTGIATGDQAMFVRADAFHAAGTFPDQALMEDIQLSKRLNAKGRPACLATPVVTSARRWQTYGFWRTVTLMWWLRWRYFWGASAQQLAESYGYRTAPPAASAAVAVLAKAPIAGMAKTRLIPLLGAQGAARQQRLLLRQTLRTVEAAAIGGLRLWCAPNVHHRCFRALRNRSGIELHAQPGGDLGERMHACVTQHFAGGTREPLLLVGTDCAVLAPGHLKAAARSLLTHDACLIPAEDGGYVLLGLRRPIPEVFVGVSWSTSEVLSQTRERLKLAGATWVELPTLWDIDEPADWRRWQALVSRQ